MKRSLLILISMAALFAIGCSSNPSVGPEEVTAKYLTALAEKDKALISSLSCAEWEESAILEVDALLSVEAAISNLACGVAEMGEGSADVVCEGSLDLTYSDEIRGIDLSRRTYRLENKNDEWLVCSYQ